MRKCSCRCVPLALLAVAGPASAQAPVAVPPVDAAVSAPPAAPHLAAPHPKPLKFPAPAHGHAVKAVSGPARPGGASGTWIRLNTHLLGVVGESTWVNLAQAANIRFYQSGKTTFAAVGVGGSSYVSTSDLTEIQKLKAYVLAHQTR